MALTVMVVDDEADVRLIARLVLGAAEFDVLEVDSGESALAELASGRTPDVVLLDVRMPGLDGWGTLRQLRGDPALAHLPVVVFTADVSARSEAPVELRDGDVLITKPFQADDLLHAVQTAVASRRAAGSA
ncbi:MAG: response regulator [Acidimicrobiales bacterium]